MEYDMGLIAVGLGTEAAKMLGKMLRYFVCRPPSTLGSLGKLGKH